jgi:hypothetical protein
MNVEYEVGMKDDSIKSKNKDISFLTQKIICNRQISAGTSYKKYTIAGIFLAFIIIGCFIAIQAKAKEHEVITQKNQQLQHLLDEKDGC